MKMKIELERSGSVLDDFRFSDRDWIQISFVSSLPFSAISLPTVYGDCVLRSEFRREHAGVVREKRWKKAREIEISVNAILAILRLWAISLLQRRAESKTQSKAPKPLPGPTGSLPTECRLGHRPADTRQYPTMDSPSPTQ